MKNLIFILTIVFSLSIFTIFGFATEKITKTDKTYTWIKVENNWNLNDKDGKKVIGWVSHDNNTYYLDKDGNMQTGWTKISTSWYYFDEDTGVMLTDKWIDNYYVDSTGKKTKTK